MANRPKGFGMTADVARKMDSKYSKEEADKAGLWIDGVLGKPCVGITASSAELHEKLKSGTLLCEVINVLVPGSIRKINESKMAFKMMENIGNFLQQCGSYGVKSTDLFQTVDLYENQNMAQVVATIITLASHAKSRGFNSGVDIGITMATQNKREFSEEQLKEGKNIISLQMGTNKGASQTGMTGYGTGRQIIN